MIHHKTLIILTVMQQKHLFTEEISVQIHEIEQDNNKIK